MFVSKSSFHVLYTDNLQATYAFYNALGASIKQALDDKVVVEMGDYSLHFILDTTEPFEEYQYIARKNDYGNGVLFYIEVEDLERAYKKVQNAGGVVKTDIKNNHWECKEFLFEDPNGYKFAFYK